MYLLLLMLYVILLKGCINQDGPIYIDHINCYVDVILVTGTTNIVITKNRKRY